MARITNKAIAEKAAEIFETLTTSYYTGTGKVAAELDGKAPTSAFDMESRTIVVSLGNIIKATRAKIDANGGTLSPLAIERSIREELYHELSHAMLTPRQLPFNYGAGHALSGYNPDFLTWDDLNVYEDERIETLFASYFMRCDFKGSIMSLCPYKEPKNFAEFAFFAVRHRRAPFKQAEANALVDSFVNATKGINSQNGLGLELVKAAQKLHEGLKALWNEYAAQRPQAQQPTQGRQGDGDAQQTQQGDQRGQGKQGEKAEDGENGAAKDAAKDAAENRGAERPDAQQAERPDAPTAKEAREIAEGAIGAMEAAAKRYEETTGIKRFPVSEKAYVEILRIITKTLGVGNASQPIQYGFSGKLSARRIAKDANDEMKWWKKRSFADGIKAPKGKKKTLNVWLDQSGSFRKHDATINGILRALVELEEKRDDFDWNLIRMNTEFVVEGNKAKRYSRSCGNNALPPKQIAECYAKTHQTSDVFDIVLFDGQTAYTRSYLGSDANVEWARNRGWLFDPLGIFNNKRAVFITEESNTSGIREVCPNCRAIIEENSDYEGKLLENIVKGLAALF